NNQFFQDKLQGCLVPEIPHIFDKNNSESFTKASKVAELQNLYHLSPSLIYATPNWKIIRLLVEDDQLHHIRNANTAKTSWENLEHYYEKHLLSTKVFLLKQLCRMRLDEKENLEEPIQQMEDIVYRLKMMDENFSEQLIVTFMLLSQLTASYSPQQNRKAEHKHRALLLLEANLEKEFWGEAIRTANYLQNRLPTSGKNKTSYELWYGVKPNISHLRTFARTAYTLIPLERRRKLDDNSKKIIFVGYEFS
ncbi:hypothetical protein ILUMI_05698, partial [Ignelater luminosus]